MTHCYLCAVLTTLLDHGKIHVHFASAVATVPCRASWRPARQMTWPFAELEEAQTS